MSRRRPLQVIQNAELVTIGELVRLSGARYSTLKFYTEEGMLHFEQEDEGLTRRYPRQKALAQLDRINGLKKQGLTITEIKNTLLEEQA
jgi:DNA-binding transcriptional MerR regulator